MRYDVIAKCECGAQGEKPINLGVVASTDPVTVDKAAVDILFAQKEHKNHDLTKRKGTFLGLYQMEYMTKLGLGRAMYKLVNVDVE